MRIDVHIERLVLDGLPVTNQDGPRVRAAVEAELARLLTAKALGGTLVAGGVAERAQAPPISIGQGERPDAIGRAVARSVHAGIKGDK